MIVACEPQGFHAFESEGASMTHSAASLTRRLRRSLRFILNQSLGRMGLELRRIPRIGANLDHDLRQRLRDIPRPVIFDIGANVGDYLMRMRRSFPEATIHAFEPNPDVFQTLQSTTKHLSSVTLNNAGMGSRREQRGLQKHSNSMMSSFLPPAVTWTKVRGETLVPVETVDEYCADRGISSIDLLKTDTQGYELEVLRGAERMFSDGRVRLVLVEFLFLPMYIEMAEPDALYRHLRDRDFRLIGIYDWAYTDDGFAGSTDALFQLALPARAEG